MCHYFMGFGSLSGDELQNESNVSLNGFIEDISEISFDESQVYKVKKLDYVNNAANISFYNGYFYLMTPVCGKQIGFVFIGNVKVHVKSDNRDFLRQINAINGKKEIINKYNTFFMYTTEDFIQKIKLEGTHPELA